MPRRTVSWTTYRDSIGDRSPMFTAIYEIWRPRTALYAGSYVDLSPSTAIESVTYVDTDRRAARFFEDEDLVARELSGRALVPGSGAVRFLAADYTHPLPLEPHSVGLLISLYAGPVWDSCCNYLVGGGLLLANTSHGDASIAALDPALRLVGAVHHRDGRYRVATDNLDTYLIPKRPESADADAIRSAGKGIAYTRSAFAYVFQHSA